jgi:hypothetical protein
MNQTIIDNRRKRIDNIAQSGDRKKMLNEYSNLLREDFQHKMGSDESIFVTSLIKRLENAIVYN